MAKLRKKKKFPLVTVIILIACACVLSFSIYKLVEIQMGYKHVSDTNNSAISDVSSTKQAGINGVTYDAAKAKSINKDAVGFIYIPANNIKLNIVQGSSNDEYLHKDFYGNYSEGGSIFIDAGIKKALDANYVLIYGHYMKDSARTMFTKNNDFKDPAFYKKEGNDLIYIFTSDEIRTYNIFSVMTNVSPNDPNIYSYGYSIPEVREKAALWSKESLYSTGVDVSKSKQVIALSSCEIDDNYATRLIILASLVKSQPNK